MTRAGSALYHDPLIAANAVAIEHITNSKDRRKQKLPKPGIEP